ncbi:MAG: hypothetical protein K0S65_5482 [Labilithrix sp.]|nr:hypothetical protein [Labilithrix sp.]
MYSGHVAIVRIGSRLAPKEFLDLTSCSTAAGVVKETLRRLEGDEPVLCTDDGLNEGPLHDVDCGGVPRRAR